VKVFEGPDVDDFRADVEKEFQYVRATSPKASRDESSEVYFIGRGGSPPPCGRATNSRSRSTPSGTRATAWRASTATGCSSPTPREGETVTVRVEDVKPNFGFAQRIDRD